MLSDRFIMRTIGSVLFTLGLINLTELFYPIFTGAYMHPNWLWSSLFISGGCISIIFSNAFNKYVD